MSGYDILINRGVTRLCHLTLLKSLTHIISSPLGIVATSSIGADTKSVNDYERRDGLTNYVCTSVQYPNSWYLTDIAGRNMDRIFREWVIIYINPSILNERNAKFCPCNAGRKNGEYINDNMDHIDFIFASRVSGWNYLRSSNMLSCCPTNGQAEILIKDNIPNRFIIGIAVENEDVAGRVYSLIKLNSMDIPVYIAPDIFTKEWSASARKGIPVTEVKYCPMEE